MTMKFVMYVIIIQYTGQWYLLLTHVRRVSWLTLTNATHVPFLFYTSFRYPFLTNYSEYIKKMLKGG